MIGRGSENAATSVAIVALVLAIAAVVILAQILIEVRSLKSGVANVSSRVSGVEAKIGEIVKDLENRIAEVREELSRLGRNITELSKLVRKRVEVPEIVVVPINRPIYGYWVDELVSLLELAGSDKNVKGFILLIDTPGGAVGPVEKLFSAIYRIGKPVYAVIAGLGTSGGYYVALAADRIYATPSSEVGSVGVLALIFPELWLQPPPEVIYTTGPYKLFGEDLFGVYDEVEKIRDNFLGLVAERRGLTMEALDEVATARIFLGVDAARLGLVDEIGTLWDAVERMAEELGLENYTVVDIYTKYINLTRLRRQPVPIVPLGSAESKIINLSRLVELYGYVPPLLADPRFVMPGKLLDGQFPQTLTVPALPSGLVKRGNLVLIDAAHLNYLPRGFLETLMAEARELNATVLVVGDEKALIDALANATALIITTPFTEMSGEFVDAVIDAAERGVRIAVFHESRAFPLVPWWAWGRIRLVDPYVELNRLLQVFGLYVYPRPAYNYTAVSYNSTGSFYGRNYQFVHAGNYVLFSPTPVGGGEPLVKANAFVRGLGEGIYAFVARSGNITVVGSMRSFSTYFVSLGSNKELLRDILEWLLEPRNITRPAPPEKHPEPPMPPIPQPIVPKPVRD